MLKKKKNSHETRVCTLKENHANPSSSIPILLFLSKPLFLERSFLFSISVYVLLCFTLWSNLASHVCFSLHHICNLLLSLFFFSRSISMPFFFVLYALWNSSLKTRFPHKWASVNTWNSSFKCSNFFTKLKSQRLEMLVYKIIS